MCVNLLARFQSESRPTPLPGACTGQTCRNVSANPTNSLFDNMFFLARSDVFRTIAPYGVATRVPRRPLN